MSEHDDVVSYVEIDMADGRYPQHQLVTLPSSEPVYQIAHIGANPDDPADRMLSLRTWRTSPADTTTMPDQCWTGGTAAISALQALLNGNFPAAGQYTLCSLDTAVAAVTQHLRDSRADSSVVARLVAAISRVGVTEIADALSEINEDGLLAGMMERRRQQRRLDEIRGIVENPKTSENDLQQALERDWWLFGGQYLDIEKRRRLTVLNQLDIPLIRPDGTIHVVELKKANVHNLVVKYRTSGWIVGPQVNSAVGQVMNYLRDLDEERDHILAKLGIDTQRASATLVIGHPRHVTVKATKTDLAATLRTYNSHLSRVQVITYQELLDGAERSLALSDPTVGPQRLRDCDDGWEPPATLAAA